MINIDSRIKIYLYAGSTDMRKGMNGLAMLAEEKIPEKYDKEGLFVFRGKNGDKLKILWWDGRKRTVKAVQPKSGKKVL